MNSEDIFNQKINNRIWKRVTRMKFGSNIARLNLKGWICDENKFFTQMFIYFVHK